jgi:hypothetical protein
LIPSNWATSPFSAATRIDSDGWTAELRIPYSQLRFSRDVAQTWGLEVRRFIKRREEEERGRRGEEERKHREEDRARSERDEDSSWSPFPSLELTAAPEPAISGSLDSDLDALKRAEAEVEKEFMAKEEAIRKALEEQERRFRLEEEAGGAMDLA